MKLTTMKSRAIALVSTTALVIGVVAAVPAHAAGPLCDGKFPVQTCGGATSDTAPYGMQIPANFNGTVVLYSHGYRPNVAIPKGIPGYGGYVVTNTPETAAGQAYGKMDTTQYLLSQGYALMGSGFARQGWNPDSAIKTNVELIGLFKEKFPTTKHVVAWGQSLGGVITQGLAEKYPNLVDAVAPMCVADNLAPELTMAGDYLWGVKTLFDPTIMAGGYAAGVAGYAQSMGDLVKFFTVMGWIKDHLVTGEYPTTSSATGKALEAKGVPLRSVVLLLGLMSGISTQSSSFDSVSGPDNANKLTFPLALSPALAVFENGASAGALAILAISDAEAQAGGAVFDNQKTDYAARIADERGVYNAALSGNSVIDGILGALSTANPGAPRAKGDAAAMAKLDALHKNTGKINVPTILMVGTADPITPAGASQRIVAAYADQFEADKAAAVKAYMTSSKFTPAANKLLMLWSTTPAEYTKFDSAGLPVSLTDTPGTGHCNFTTDQLLVVAKTLVAAGTTGKLPKRSATSALVRRTENLTTDPYFEPALLKYYDKL